MHTTTSIGEAAWLLCQGYQPLEVTGDRIRTFVFPDECAKAAVEYYRGGTCSARSYHLSLQQAKRLIFA